jgi:hypothetical protein
VQQDILSIEWLIKLHILTREGGREGKETHLLTFHLLHRVKSFILWNYLSCQSMLFG